MEIHQIDGVKNPLNVVQELAELRDWNFRRMDDDQLAMVVEGQWRIFSLTLSWCQSDELLKLVCSFDLDPLPSREAELLNVLNRINERCWIGAFTLWLERKLAVFRSGIILSEEISVGVDHIDRLICEAIEMCDRFYPAFQMVNIGNASASESLGIAIVDVQGHA